MLNHYQNGNLDIKSNFTNMFNQFINIVDNGHFVVAKFCIEYSNSHHLLRIGFKLRGLNQDGSGVAQNTL